MVDLPHRIVFVDDDRPIIGLVEEIIKRASPDVVFVGCESGKEFLSRLWELNPDLILLDLDMPEMSGVDVVEALRDEEGAEDIPIIFMTGHLQVKMSEDYKALGVIGVLHKPFSSQDLASQISDLWVKKAKA